MNLNLRTQESKNAATNIFKNKRTIINESLNM